MKPTKILSLLTDNGTLGIALLEIHELTYYFVFNETEDDMEPLPGEARLYSDFESLWNDCDTDPFEFFPGSGKDLPASVNDFLRTEFNQKKQLRELNVFLIERWTQCLYSSMEDEIKTNTYQSQ